MIKKSITVMMLACLLSACNGLDVFRQYEGTYMLTKGSCPSLEILNIELGAFNGNNFLKVSIGPTEIGRGDSFLVAYGEEQINSFDESCEIEIPGFVRGEACEQRRVIFENGVFSDSIQTILRFEAPGSGTKVEQVLVPWKNQIHAVLDGKTARITGAAVNGKACTYSR